MSRVTTSPVPLFIITSSLVAMLVVTADGCCGHGCSCSTPTESYVDVPTTLEEAKALHSPPAVVVNVTRQKAQAGGAPCHSGVCLILLPVIVYSLVFPERWDEVTITKNGRVTMEGRYTTDGELTEATLIGDGLKRSVLPVPLKELGKNLILEVAHTKLSADGTPAGPPERSKILPQVDLASMYRDALDSERNDERRGYLLAECGTVLQEESLPLLRSVLPNERDRSAKLVVEGLCQGLRPSWSHERVPRWKTGHHELIEMVKGHHGLETTTAAYQCARWYDSVEVSALLAKRLVAASCVDPNVVAVRDAINSIAFVSDEPPPDVPDTKRWSVDAERLNRTLQSAAAACQTKDRRAFMKLRLAMPIDDSELVEIMSSESSFVDDIGVELCEARGPAARERVYKMLSKRGAQPPLLRALSKRPYPNPTPDQYATLAEVYADRLGDGADVGVRADLIDMFDHAEGRGDLITGARAKLHAKLAATPVKRRPLLRIALAVLGEVDQELPATRGLEGLHRLPFTERNNTVIYGLQLRGCGRDEIMKMAQTAASVSDGGRGAVCPGR